MGKVFATKDEDLAWVLVIKCGPIHYLLNHGAGVAICSSLISGDPSGSYQIMFCSAL